MRGNFLVALLNLDRRPRTKLESGPSGGQFSLTKHLVKRGRSSVWSEELLTKLPKHERWHPSPELSSQRELRENLERSPLKKKFPQEAILLSPDSLSGSSPLQLNKARSFYSVESTFKGRALSAYGFHNMEHNMEHSMIWSTREKHSKNAIGIHL